MAPSTEPLDDLLAWHPGAPEAATTSVPAALAWGARRAAGAKLLIVLLWLAYVLLVLGGDGALLGALRTPAALPDAAQAIIDNATAAGATAPVSATALYRIVVLESFTRQPWVPSGFFLLLYGVLAGGAISYLHAPRPAPLLAQLGATAGAFTGRFLRLLLAAATAIWLLMRGARFLPAGNTGETAQALQLGLLLAALMALAAIFDYARVRTVARDSRSMVLELARSARFFVRHLPRTLALEIALLLLTVAVGTLVLGVRALLAAAFEPRTATFLASQITVVGLLWVRLTAWGAMLALYQGIALERLSRR